MARGPRGAGARRRAARAGLPGRTRDPEARRQRAGRRHRRCDHRRRRLSAHERRGWRQLLADLRRTAPNSPRAERRWPVRCGRRPRHLSRTVRRGDSRARRRGGADSARGRVGMVGSPRHEPRPAGLADRLERAVRRRDQLRPRRLSALARPAPRDDGRRRSVRRRRAGRAAAGALAHLSSRAPGPRALRAGRPRRDARGACAGWHRHVLPRRARPTDRTGRRRRRQPPDRRGSGRAPGGVGGAPARCLPQRRGGEPAPADAGLRRPGDPVDARGIRHRVAPRGRLRPPRRRGDEARLRGPRPLLDRPDLRARPGRALSRPGERRGRRAARRSRATRSRSSQPTPPATRCPSSRACTGSSARA